MKRLKAILDFSVTIAVLVAAGLVIWRQFEPVGPQARSPVENANGTIPAELSNHIRGMGQVALVEFADFQCPFCGQYARDVEPMIRKAFVDTGVVRQVFVNLPLPNHPRALPASEAAACAGNQGKFWEMHDAMFQNQSALADADLTNRARELGLDVAQFSKCLDGDEARSVIERHMDVARDLNVRATPAFFVGIVQPDGSVKLKKRINGALGFDDFRSAIMDVTPRELKDRVRDVAVSVTPSVRSIWLRTSGTKG